MYRDGERTSSRFSHLASSWSVSADEHSHAISVSTLSSLIDQPPSSEIDIAKWVILPCFPANNLDFIGTSCHLCLNLPSCHLSFGQLCGVGWYLVGRSMALALPPSLLFLRFQWVCGEPFSIRRRTNEPANERTK